MTDLFCRLKRLFPSNGFPSEDYLTEIVATVIERQPKAFIDWLRTLGATQLDASASLSVRTQFHCPRNDEEQIPEKYPDFLIHLSDGVSEEIIFIESKVGSELSGEDQLQVYARILSGFPAARRTLLFITRDYYPQDKDAVLSKVPSDRQKPEFVQTRWSNFAGYFGRRGSVSAADPVVSELIDFMKKEQLTQDHQFTPQDIAAITGFRHAYSVMRSVIDDDLRARLSAVCGELRDDYDTDVQVIRAPMLALRNRPKNRNVSVTVGFWLEADDDGYPGLFGDISFDAKTQDRAAVATAMLKFAASRKDWKAEDVSATSSWGRIVKECSLGVFLGEPNHAHAIKKFLGGIIDDISEFKTANSKLTWG